MKPTPLDSHIIARIINGDLVVTRNATSDREGSGWYKKEEVRAATDFLIDKIIEDWPLRCDTLTEKNVRVDNGIFDFVQSKIKEAFPDVLEEQAVLPKIDLPEGHDKFYATKENLNDIQSKAECLCGKELGKPCLVCGNGEFKDDKEKLLARLDSLYTRANAEKISIERISGAEKRYDDLLAELDSIRKWVRGEED